MAETRILAADVGGTKTDMALFRVVGERTELLRTKRFHSAEHAGLEDVVEEFLGGETVQAAGCAAAGPVREGRIQTTNLPWTISSEQLARRLGGAQVILLNDLEAAAVGTSTLSADDLHSLKDGRALAANRAMLSPGTGLGQAILFWDGTQHLVSPSEGGHVGFAPRDEQQIELLRFLQRHHPQVSFEHILSGPGLVGIFEFVTEILATPAAESVRGQLAGEKNAAPIGEAAVAGSCPASRQSVEIFAHILAARAGDLALSVLARGGIYLGGGMLPKLLPVIEAAGFYESFVGRGPFRDLLAEIPVHAVLEEKVALFGAARAAARRVGDAVPRVR